jgi:signal transduction histidine kinase
VNDILDFSKIEAGKLELHFTTFDLRALAREVATTVAPLLERNRNRLVVDAGEPVGPVRLDELRVKQILLNLLSNA